MFLLTKITTVISFKIDIIIFPFEKVMTILFLDLPIIKDISLDEYKSPIAHERMRPQASWNDSTNQNNFIFVISLKEKVNKVLLASYIIC